jgi:hypothetical protein
MDGLDSVDMTVCPLFLPYTDSKRDLYLKSIVPIGILFSGSLILSNTAYLTSVYPLITDSISGADDQSKRVFHPDVESLYSSGYTPNLSSIQDPKSESEVDLDCPCMSTSPRLLPEKVG